VIYIKRTQPSNSARELVAALQGRRLRENSRFRPGAEDVIISWGESYTGTGKVLNGTPVRNKLHDALCLANAGVATITISQTRPVEAAPVAPPVDPIVAQWEELNEIISAVPRTFPGRTAVLTSAVDQFGSLISDIQRSIHAGPPVAQQLAQAIQWLGRDRNHIGGRDLLNPPIRPDFWVRKEELACEYRIHSFLGSSIRAGKKKKVEGHPHDPATEWIRGLLNGWKISYDGVSIRQRHRDLAHLACQALGLNFGAVDLGEKADGSLLVLEVNRAPGLDGGTITAYAGAIRRWIDAGYPDVLPEGVGA
jgi:hypothetical protein